MLVGATVASAACTPIGVRSGDDSRTDAEARDAPAGGEAASLEYDPASRPLRVGEPAPDVELIDAEGQRIRLAEPHDGILVLTFVSVDETGPEGELLARLARFKRSLATPATGQILVLCVVLDAANEDLYQAIPQTTAGAGGLSAPCTFVRASRDDSAMVAGAFGIAVWHTPDGTVQHTFNTAVLDRRRRLADQFPGLDGWSAMDLAGAVSVAAGR
jgi:hypothetical protein